MSPSSSGPHRRPLIGLTASTEKVTYGGWVEKAAFVPLTYTDAVTRAGGIPVILPPSSARPREVLAGLDGLILTGGNDVDPAVYGQAPHPHTGKARPERDDWEIALTRHALAEKLPLLAICRGHQILNVALGGSLEQHLEDRLGPNQHLVAFGQFNPHTVSVDPGSRLFPVLGEQAPIRCHHHQAVDGIGRGLTVIGRSFDGTVEAVEVEDHPWAVGVQWHPEEDPDDLRLFVAFVEAAAAGASADADARADAGSAAGARAGSAADARADAGSAAGDSATAARR